MLQYQMARLEIRHLAVLHEVARWGTASAAAEHLGLTASAASHRIREAERRLGVQLTTRSGSSLKLTEAGHRLVRTAEKVFDEMQRAEIDARRLALNAGPVVRFCVGTYIHYDWLPEFLRDLANSDANIKFEVMGEATPHPIDYILDERIDIALVPGPIATLGLKMLPAFTDELVCVTNPSHRLAKCDFVDAVDLADDTQFTYSSEISLGFEYDRFFRPAGHFPSKLLNIALPEAAIEMASAGSGLAILSRWALQKRLQRNELSAARLTSSGLDLQWQIVLSASQPANSHIPMVAQELSKWLQAKFSATES
ncbi:LysR family transcriptional regulator [Xinfangfangia sp. CPCC 101601]|uniref:LysR family transcriptional regulator n=1 Tax=Pseudogemmobacter lacusdianii TaxID=3069608 RepID=A0ABU0W0T1_9RHOB|nr:LysR family transcriptional regulator [Xinfangfangia sp. CPCC 101601]MDQ2067608.1 LysR family transcriptional regulator [Xinfangfangia sp. CPCC 101601]